MSETENSTLKRQIEELQKENKRLQQNNQCFEIQKAIEKVHSSLKSESLVSIRLSILQCQNEELRAENKRLKRDNEKRLKRDNEEIAGLRTENKKLKRVKRAALKPGSMQLDELVKNSELKRVAWQIFKELDPKSLGKCRLVSKAWRECIDNDKHWWQCILVKYYQDYIDTHSDKEFLCDFGLAMDYVRKCEPFNNLKIFTTFVSSSCFSKICQKAWN